MAPQHVGPQSAVAGEPLLAISAYQYLSLLLVFQYEFLVQVPSWLN